MKFSKKIFISVFAAILILSSVLIWITQRHAAQQTTSAFKSRYSVFSKIMGDTLSRLDTNTEALMLNAAKVVAAKDAINGPLSTESLKKIRSELSVTHIFVIDNQGNFIRSTNENPRLIPNAFSFCPAYKNLLNGRSNMEATPVIHPQPEPKPYKFLFIPSYDRKRLLEVGVRIDFIAKTLTDALGSDSNILSLSLYAPDGTSFGNFSANTIDFDGKKIELPHNFPNVVEEQDHFRFYTKVQSSHPQCCQCDVSGTSRNGEYYYILESKISKNELKTMQATTKTTFAFLSLANIILAFVFSRFLSRRLVKNIEAAVTKVKTIKESGTLKERIQLTGEDEVAYLSNEYDLLLDSLNEKQQKIIASEIEHAKAQIKVQLAKEIAHNIKSPIVAVEMMLPMLPKLSERATKVLHGSVSEIKSLADRLSNQAHSLAEGADKNQQYAAVCPSSLLEDVLQEKKIEYSNLSHLDLDFYYDETILRKIVHVDAIEFRSVISNLINNSIASYNGRNGLVSLRCKCNDNSTCTIIVSDKGKGIPKGILAQLGKTVISFDKQDGKGIGLLHAHRVVQNWGGQIEIHSLENVGTSIAITLPTVERISSIELLKKTNAEISA